MVETSVQLILAKNMAIVRGVPIKKVRVKSINKGARQKIYPPKEVEIQMLYCLQCRMKKPFIIAVKKGCKSKIAYKQCIICGTKISIQFCIRCDVNTKHVEHQVFITCWQCGKSRV